MRVNAQTCTSNSATDAQCTHTYTASCWCLEEKEGDLTFHKDFGRSTAKCSFFLILVVANRDSYKMGTGVRIVQLGVDCSVGLWWASSDDELKDEQKEAADVRAKYFHGHKTRFG